MSHRLLTLFKASAISGALNSVQRVAVTIPAGATSASQAISAVDTSRAFAVWDGQTTDNVGSSAAEVYARVELTNATTVTAYRNTSSATYQVTVQVSVAEFKASAVASVQAGTITLDSVTTTNTATISSVASSRAVPFYLGLTTTQTTAGASAVLTAIDLTNATTVTATRASSGSQSITVGYAVVEFKAGVTKSIQPRALTVTTANTSDTDTISTVSTGNTLILYNGATSANANNNAYHTVRLSDATSVTVERSGTNTGSRTVKYTALEFVPGVLKSLQRNTANFSLPPSDATISAVSTAKSLVLFGHCLTASSAGFPQIFASTQLTSATNVRSDKVGTGVTSGTAWEVVEFN